MTTLFLYEYATAPVPGREALPASIRREGKAMHWAVTYDCQRTREIRILSLPETAAEEEPFRDLAAAADWSLIIAPETGGLLAERCRWVEESGGRLLGPSSAAVELTTDKLAFVSHLERAGIPTPPCVSRDKVRFPAVWKPRDGAGSQATFLVRDESELSRCREQARAEGWDGEAILQPFIPGRAASCAILCGPRECIPLPPAEQLLSTDGRFHYLGGSVPLPAPLAERAQRLACRAVKTVPGMRGYVGVDLVLGDADDGGEDVVIEINPRLTTSYIGLSFLAAGNLMRAMLSVAKGEAVSLAWRPQVVKFQPDGSVSILPTKAV